MGNFKVFNCIVYITSGRSVIVSSNIVTGRQLRAARVMAGLTQRQLAVESGFAPRACRYWERRATGMPTGTPDTLTAIEETLRRHGVKVFRDPTPGCCLVSSK